MGHQYTHGTVVISQSVAVPAHSGGTFAVTITTDKTSLDFAGAGASETTTITVSALGASYVGFGIDVPNGYTASPSRSDVKNETNTWTVTITAGEGAVSGEAVIYGAAFNGNFEPLVTTLSKLQ